MSESEFKDRLGREFQRRKRKLEAYEDFIKTLLQEAQFLSSAQIHDRPCFAIGYDTPENYRKRYYRGELPRKNTFETREASPEPKFVRE